MSVMDEQMHDGAPTSDRKMLKIGLPALLAVGGLAVVPFVLNGGNDSIATAETTTTLAATTTTTTVAPDADTFSTVDTEPAVVVAEVEVATTVAPTTTSTTTTSTTTTTTTTVPAPLPRQETAPIAPPPDPRGAEDQVRLGGISIPKLGVNAPLLEGIRLTTLDNGPGHWPGTAMPGQIGNVVVAAHRTSHGGPFRNIDQLVAGDVVLFDTAVGQTEYKVTGTQIVNPDAVWIVDPTDTPTATLFACHPPGSVAQRIVVNLELST